MESSLLSLPSYGLPQFPRAFQAHLFFRQHFQHPVKTELKPRLGGVVRSLAQGTEEQEEMELELKVGHDLPLPPPQLVLP